MNKRQELTNLLGLLGYYLLQPEPGNTMTDLLYYLDKACMENKVIALDKLLKQVPDLKPFEEHPRFQAVYEDVAAECKRIEREVMQQ